MDTTLDILDDRRPHIQRVGVAEQQMECGKQSLAGAVSQRACVFCGSRVVLYPIADALHLIHGPVGCAAYTWDIRGALSSGPELHRMSFTTDLREKDVIYGGEKKLYRRSDELIDYYQPKAAFVYSTCIVGIIGDDVEAICKRVAAEKKSPCLPVHSEGFKGTKKRWIQGCLCRHVSTGWYRVHRGDLETQHQYRGRLQSGGRNMDDSRLLPADRRRGGGHNDRRRSGRRHSSQPWRGA